MPALKYGGNNHLSASEVQLKNLFIWYHGLDNLFLMAYPYLFFIPLGKGIRKKSESAFIFSLQNKDSLPPFKSSILKVEEAAVANRNHGALFGTGTVSTDYDLFITGHPPTQQCYSDLGNAYKLPDGYEEGTDKARCLLAGSFKFTPNEIEVFCQKKN